ncbi:MAG: hypothetical protein OEV59_02310 [Deltaproteobacteria bacterium]|nr:hypothetical protein [Deltaproteobacteria bacterium]
MTVEARKVTIGEERVSDIVKTVNALFYGIAKKHGELKASRFGVFADSFAAACWLYRENIGTVASRMHEELFKAMHEEFSSMGLSEVELKEIERNMSALTEFIKRHRFDGKKMEVLFDASRPHAGMHELLLAKARVTGSEAGGGGAQGSLLSKAGA